MDAKIANASLAYARALERLGQGGGTASSGASGGPSFAELVREAGAGAMESARSSEALSLKSLSAVKPELTEIVAAVTNAEVAVETVTAIRDRVIGAYQEIMRMPI
ncbi:MAG: flagellar hook-basal body complex protein FliE [Alphaproteobacteria bacterium]|nr:flagellar hook-basal body complex protein FliE [Alphaproteobacteria bacterium]